MNFPQKNYCDFCCYLNGYDCKFFHARSSKAILKFYIYRCMEFTSVNIFKNKTSALDILSFLISAIFLADDVMRREKTVKLSYFTLTVKKKLKLIPVSKICCIKYDSLDVINLLSRHWHLVSAFFSFAKNLNSTLWFRENCYYACRVLKIPHSASMCTKYLLKISKFFPIKKEKKTKNIKYFILLVLHE